MTNDDKAANQYSSTITSGNTIVTAFDELLKVEGMLASAIYYPGKELLSLEPRA